MTGEPLHFLIVDDDDDHAELIIMALESGQIECTFDRVGGGEDALNYVRGTGAFADRPRPNVVLLDLKLPKCDGHAVLETVKADPTLRSIRVIVLTTSDAEKDKTRAYANHVDSYLVKPVDFHMLHHMVHDLLTYWSTWNSMPVSEHGVRDVA